MDLDDLRRYAVARSLFKPTSLAKAIDKLVSVRTRWGLIGALLHSSGRTR